MILRYWILRDQARAIIKNYLKLRRFTWCQPHVWLLAITWDFCANVIFHGREIFMKSMIFVDFRVVLEFLSVVWALKLGIRSWDHINSDSQADSSQKIFNQKFEPGESLPRGDEKFRFLRKSTFWSNLVKRKSGPKGRFPDGLRP